MGHEYQSPSAAACPGDPTIESCIPSAGPSAETGEREQETDVSIGQEDAQTQLKLLAEAAQAHKKCHPEVTESKPWRLASRFIGIPYNGCSVTVSQSRCLAYLRLRTQLMPRDTAKYPACTELVLSLIEQGQTVQVEAVRACGFSCLPERTADGPVSAEAIKRLAELHSGAVAARNNTARKAMRATVPILHRARRTPGIEPSMPPS